MNLLKRRWLQVCLLAALIVVASLVWSSCGTSNPYSYTTQVMCDDPNGFKANMATCTAYFQSVQCYQDMIAGLEPKPGCPMPKHAIEEVNGSVAARAPLAPCPPILFSQASIEQTVDFDSTGQTIYTVPLYRQPDGNYTGQGFSVPDSAPNTAGTKIGSLTQAQSYFAGCRGLAPWTPAPHPTVLADMPGTMSRDLVATNLGGSPYAAIKVNSASNLITVVLDTQDTLGSSSTDYPVGRSPTSLLIADFNGDGKRDVATLNQSGFDSAGNGSVSILLGNGNGTLRASATYSTGGQSPVAMTSFNLNGRANLAVVNSDDNTVTVLLANADGSMRPAVPYALQGGLYEQQMAIVAADFDGDGKADLMAYSTNQGFTLLHGNGDGSFQIVPQKAGYTPHNSTLYLTPGDFNKDGKTDLASFNWDGTVTILLNAGDGSFPNQSRYVVGSPFSSGSYELGMFAVDFNDDGNLDLVLGTGHPDALYPNPMFVTVLLGKGDGTFQAAAPAYQVGNGPVAMAMADFNGDGRRDLVVSANGSQYNPSLWILLGQAGGFQPPTEVSMPTFYAAKWVATADLNGDGRADLIAIDNIYQQTGHVYTWLGKGDGTFQAPSTYAAGIQPTFVTASDVNGDGLPDLLISYGYQDATTAGATTALLLTAKSGGGFNAGVAIPTGVNTVQVMLADVNGDGQPDLVAVNLGIADTGYGGAVPAPGNVSVSLGNGNGTFKAPVNYTVGVNPIWAAVGDVNGDGRPDLIVGAVTATQAKIGVLLGSANGTFGAATLFDTYSWPSRLTLTDFDGDGKLDLAIVHEAGDSPVSVMQGNGDGTFQPESLVFAGDYPAAVIAADFTGSGRSDLAVLNNAYPGWGSLNLFRNISAAPACTYSLSGGSQSFTAPGGAGSFQVAAGSGCNWSAASSADWIRPAFPGFGASNGTVSFSVLANTGAARSGTVTVGGQTFTVNQAAGANAGPPQAVSANPGAGATSPQTFTFTFSDPDGYQDLDVVNVLINNFLDGRNACYLAYSRPSNVLYLVPDAGGGLLPGLLLNAAGSVNNSQCAVTASSSSASGSGNTLTLTLSISFSAGFAGNKVIYLAARDLEGGNSNWQVLGTWGVPGTAPTGPSVGGVNPARSSGTGAQTFAFTFNDTNGYQDLGVVNVLINDALNGNNACYLAYSRAGNVLYLVNDPGTALLPGLVLAGSGSVNNSQCAVTGAGSSASGSGNTLTLTLNLSFPSTFAGNRLLYLAARSNGDVLNSGWQAVGSRTVQ